MADSASMKYFGSTPFIDLLPPVIAVDASFARAATAIDASLEASAKAVSNTLIFARLAADSGFSRPVSMLAPLERLAALTSGLAPLPRAVLDLLAWQLHVESYDEAASEKAKREMIWSSVILHRKRGTPWAVKHGLETTLQVPAEISEWFDYDGEPYFFRVTLDVSGTPVDARRLESAVKVIFAHKNVRSWLDYLRTKTTREIPVFVASGAVNRTKTLAFTWRWPMEAPDLPARAGLALYGKSCCKASLLNREPEPGAVAPYSTLTAYSFTRSKIEEFNLGA